MPSDDWLLVETLLSDGEPTVVAAGAHPRHWSGLGSLRRVLGPSRARIAAEAVRLCAAGGGSQRVVEADTLVVAEPVPCAFGGVHGVRLWAGAVDTPIQPPRLVAAWDWEADTELAHHGPGLEELVFARDPEQVRVIRTPPEAFGRMARFDGRIDYFAMVARIDDGGQWQGEVDMAGDDDEVRHFQMITRAVPSHRRISALMHAIPELDTAQPAADPDAAMLRAVSQRSGVGVGIIELTSALIYEWAGPPPPPLDRWLVERPAIDPGDLAALRAACHDLARTPGITRRLALRVRFAQGEWVAAHAELVAVSAAASGHGLLRVWSADAGRSA
ncbi:GAF domain-containing protein [Nocardia sp. NPDC058519]|uniref:GAF domain-containing protein n=1 Tax=Nocardia sp. NPDC058519 TaxID=3346535 RepID=UPI00365672A9